MFIRLSILRCVPTLGKLRLILNNPQRGQYWPEGPKYTYFSFLLEASKSLNYFFGRPLYVFFFFLFFFQKKTPSISYKILQMRLVCTDPWRDAIVPSYVEAHWLKKGRGRPLLDEGYSLSFNSIGAALEAIILAL